MEWVCQLSEDGEYLELKYDKSPHIMRRYKLLWPENICDRCSYPKSYPGYKRHNCFSYGFVKARAVGPYTGFGGYDDLTHDINALKSEEQYSEPLGLAMSWCLKYLYPEILKDIDIITFIPSYGEYSPAEQLANIISEQTGIRVIKTLIKVSPQKTKYLKRSDRLRFAKKSYLVIKDLRIKGNVLLVDDILTTGATASACAQKLLDLGVTKVYVMVAGRKILL